MRLRPTRLMKIAEGVRMRLTAIAKAAGALVLAASFSAPAVLIAAPAHADSDMEVQFFKYLDEKGVPYGRKMDAIRTARATCLKVSRPGNPGNIGYAIQQDLRKDMGLNADQSGQFITASVYAFCPQVWHIDTGA